MLSRSHMREQPNGTPGKKPPAPTVEGSGRAGSLDGNELMARRRHVGAAPVDCQQGGQTREVMGRSARSSVWRRPLKGFVSARKRAMR